MCCLYLFTPGEKRSTSNLGSSPCIAALNPYFPRMKKKNLFSTTKTSHIYRYFRQAAEATLPSPRGFPLALNLGKLFSM